MDNEHLGNISIMVEMPMLAFQPESIAYTVCQHYGLDTSDYSFGYVASWSSNKELAELKASLETIRATAAELITEIDGHFAEFQKDREQTAEHQPGYEEWSEPATAENAPDNLGVPSDDVNVYLTEQDKQATPPADKVKAVLIYRTEDELHYCLEKIDNHGRYDDNAPCSSQYYELPEDFYIEKSNGHLQVRQYDTSNQVEILRGQDGTPDLAVFDKPGTSEYHRIPLATSPDKLYSSREALDMSIAEKNGVDLPYMEQLTGMDEETIKEALKGEIFLSFGSNDIPHYVTADEFLSGDLQDKLMQVQAANKALGDNYFAEYVTALENAILNNNHSADTAEHQPGYEKWSEPATAENAPDNFSVPSDNVNDYLERERATFSIYQLKQDDSTRNLRSEPFEQLQALGLAVDRLNYELVYSAPISYDTGTLEDIYKKFNIDRPEDFTGHALSVSDVVTLNRDGKETAHYVDSYGFREISEFLQPATEHPLLDMEHTAEYLQSIQSLDDKVPAVSAASLNRTRGRTGKALPYNSTAKRTGKLLSGVHNDFTQGISHIETAEKSTEQNYNMIDGIPNNTPTVGELEAQVKAGQTISLTDLAQAIKAEQAEPARDTEEKPSIRKQLAAYKEQLTEYREQVAQEKTAVKDKKPCLEV